MNVIKVPLHLIEKNPYQARVNIGDISELAVDIYNNDLLQNPIGRIVKPGGAALTSAEFAMLVLTDQNIAELDNHGFKVEIAFGHRRLAAFKHLAGDVKKFERMPVDLRVLSNLQMAAYGWSENDKHKSLTAIERAMAIQKRIDEFHWTQEEASAELGLSRSTVSNILRLLQLPEAIRVDILEGKISERQAMALLPVVGDEKQSPETVEALIEAARSGVSSEDLRAQAANAMHKEDEPVEPQHLPLELEVDYDLWPMEAAPEYPEGYGDEQTPPSQPPPPAPEPIPTPAQITAPVLAKPVQTKLNLPEEKKALPAEKKPEPPPAPPPEPVKPLTWPECTITATLSWMPVVDGHRMATIGLRARPTDAPIFRFVSNAKFDSREVFAALQEMIIELSKKIVTENGGEHVNV